MAPRCASVQYIGKLMRSIDPEPVLVKLAERKHRHDLEIRHFQQIERWRDRLLSEPVAGVAELLEEFPTIDQDALRKLLEKAEREKAEQRSPVGGPRVVCLPASVVRMKPLVGIIMGSSSDWETMQGAAADTLTALNIPHERCAWLSAHRTPDLLFEYAGSARERGLKAIIAGAGWRRAPAGDGGGKNLGSHPRGTGAVEEPERHRFAAGPSPRCRADVPVATFAIGAAGAKNAALFAAALLANEMIEVRIALDAFRAAQTAAVLARPDPRQP